MKGKLIKKGPQFGRVENGQIVVDGHDTLFVVDEDLRFTTHKYYMEKDAYYSCQEYIFDKLKNILKNKDFLVVYPYDDLNNVKSIMEYSFANDLNVFPLLEIEDYTLDKEEQECNVFYIMFNDNMDLTSLIDELIKMSNSLLYFNNKYGSEKALQCDEKGNELIDIDLYVVLMDVVGAKNIYIPCNSVD